MQQCEHEQIRYRSYTQTIQGYTLPGSVSVLIEHLHNVHMYTCGCYGNIKVQKCTIEIEWTTYKLGINLKVDM